MLTFDCKQVLFGLSADVNLNSLAEDLLSLLSPEGFGAQSTVASSEYKLKATVGFSSWYEFPHEVIHLWEIFYPSN